VNVPPFCETSRTCTDAPWKPCCQWTTAKAKTFPQEGTIVAFNIEQDKPNNPSVQASLHFQVKCPVPSACDKNILDGISAAIGALSLQARYSAHSAPLGKCFALWNASRLALPGTTGGRNCEELARWSSPRALYPPILNTRGTGVWVFVLSIITYFSYSCCLNMTSHYYKRRPQEIFISNSGRSAVLR
jgi:hypothetical protein